MKERPILFSGAMVRALINPWVWVVRFTRRRAP